MASSAERVNTAIENIIKESQTNKNEYQEKKKKEKTKPKL